MDPLSDVLSLLKPRSYLSGGFDVGGKLSVQFGVHEGVKCYAVVSGEIWLAVQGVSDPVRLKTGDCFLLPRGWPFRLATDLAAPPVEALSILATATRSGGVVIVNGGGDCLVVGGHFALAGDHAGMLLGILPPIVHIRKESDKAAMRWSLERMRQVLREGQPGGFLMAQHLAHLMLLQALRLHLAEGPAGGVGWLFALGDKQISVAISAIHEAPAQRWTLQALAERAGMSRSTFALKFKERVGESPMEYLTRWRMLLAGDRLMNSNEPVSVIARSLGYESESAFSTAFRRVMGCPPRRYGRRPAQPMPQSTDKEVTGANGLEPVGG
jgi:AraC-like DNA-binding protein